MIENLEEALKGIFSHKMRSFLTMLGVIIGIAAILAIVSIVEGTSIKLQKNLIGAGNNCITLTLGQGEGDDGRMYDGGSDEYGPEMINFNSNALKKIKKIDHVDAVTSFYKVDIYDGINRNDRTISNTTSIYGIDKSYFPTLKCTLTKGRNFSKSEYNGTSKVCIVNSYVAESLFPNEEAVGGIIDINKEPFLIVGIVDSANYNKKDYETEEDFYREQYSSGSSCIYLPEKAWGIPLAFDRAKAVSVQVDETKEMKSVGNQAADILNANTLPDGYTYKPDTSDESENELKTLTTAITAMLVSIASLSLLVGGIGVMNIMLVSVTERTTEIGLKKALGAKRKSILIQFLTESAVLTGVGGIIGILLGIALAKGISIVVGLEFAIPVHWILISLGFSLLIGIFFGVMPANKAAKLNPIDALRRE